MIIQPNDMPQGSVVIDLVNERRRRERAAIIDASVKAGQRRRHGFTLDELLDPSNGNNPDGGHAA